MGRASSQAGGLFGRIASLASADAATWLRLGSIIGMFVVGGSLGVVALMVLGRIEGSTAVRLSQSPPMLVIHWPVLEAADGGSPGDATWMPATLRSELESLAIGRVVADDPLSGESLARIGSSLRATGWFEGSPVVRRSFRADQPVIDISGVWRAPVAVVRYDDLDYLVAKDGRLLPARYSPGASAMPVVLGVANAPPSNHETGALAFGEPWTGAEVGEALDLLRLMSMMPFAQQVSGVDVSGHTHTGRLEIVTDRQTRVMWGGGPQRPLPGEARTEGKVALLLDIVRRYGRIDAGQQRLEIFSDRVVIDRTASALATAPAP